MREKLAPLPTTSRNESIRLSCDRGHQVRVDGVDTETQFSGKAGLGIPVSDAVGVYGEVSFLTADDSDDLGVGGKLGLKYNF